MTETRIEPHPDLELPEGEYPVNKRRPTKNPKVLKLREITTKSLIDAGLENVAKEAGLIPRK